MNEIVIYSALVLFGAALGSFAGAQVWRLRARQLAEDKRDGEEVDGAELKRLKPLLDKKGRADRSIDLDTGKRLPWYDLIPIVSWLLLRGKSRFSGKPIGWFELVIEVGMVAFFVLSYAFWPVPVDTPIEVTKFIIWLIAGVILAVQFATDYKWQILWTLLNYVTIGLGLIFATLTILAAPAPLEALYSVAGSVAILGGLYFVLYWVSRERWVGLGDAFLGLGLSLFLADWMLALVALFMANLIGTIFVLIGFATGRVKRGQHVSFGPLLIIGAVIAQLFGHTILSWYFSIFFA